jgi:hypothetical protein
MSILWNHRLLNVAGEPFSPSRWISQRLTMERYRVFYRVLFLFAQCVVYLPVEAFMGANQEYKSSVFSLLFGKENTLRELYEALEGVTLPPDVWKLEDALVVEREEGREEVAKNALVKGASVKFIREITGLSTGTIQSLANR